MSTPKSRLFLEVDDPGHLRRIRGPLPADGFFLRFCLVDPPRKAAAARLRQQLAALAPDAAFFPYVWHLVSHGPRDGLRGQGTRSLAGPPHAFGELRDTPEVAQALEASVSGAQGFEARAMVLETPPALSPGAVGRARLQAFAARLRAAGFDLVWAPSGLWTEEEAAAMASSLGATLVWPGLTAGQVELSPPAEAWLRITGAGRAGRLRPEHVDDLAELRAEGVSLVLSGPGAVANLRTLAEA